jgi:hypothetical protein
MNRVLVMGSSSRLWPDLQALAQITGDGRWPWTVIGVNMAGWAYPFDLHHWATLHPDHFRIWKPLRESLRYPMGFKSWGGRWVTGSTDEDHEEVDEVLDVDRVGSSGMLAVDIARKRLEADRIVIAGMPVDATRRFYDFRPWDSALTYQVRWRESIEDFDGRVRSMSGFTKEILGAPDRSWLGL